MIGKGEIMKYNIPGAFGEFFQELIGLALFGCLTLGIIGVVGSLLPPQLSNGSFATQHNFFRSIPGILFSISLLLISINGAYYFYVRSIEDPWSKWHDKSYIGSGIIWANSFILLLFFIGMMLAPYKN